MIKDIWVKLLLLCLIGFFPGMSGSTAFASAEKIKIGFAGPLSGELASYGISALRGVELAVKDINLKGGISGRQHQLLAEDDLCKPKDATMKAEKLVIKGVQFVVGHICSGATQAVLDIYENANIIVMSPSATHPDLTQGGAYPNFYRTIASDDTQAKVQIDFVLNILKLSKIAVFHDKSVYGEGLAGFIKSILSTSHGAEMVLYEGIPPGTIDYASLMQKVKRKDAEAILFGGYHPQASKIVTQMRKRKMKTLFISGDGIKVRAFLVSAGKHAEGVYATAPKETSNIPMAVTATDTHQREYGAAPGTFFLNAYSATVALAHALEKSGSTNYNALSKALKREQVETPLGKISFNSQGDAIGPGLGFSVYKVEGGSFIQVR